MIRTSVKKELNANVHLKYANFSEHTSNLKEGSCQYRKEYAGTNLVYTEPLPHLQNYSGFQYALIQKFHRPLLRSGSIHDFKTVFSVLLGYFRYEY